MSRATRAATSRRTLVMTTPRQAETLRNDSPRACAVPTYACRALAPSDEAGLHSLGSLSDIAWRSPGRIVDHGRHTRRGGLVPYSTQSRQYRARAALHPSRAVPALSLQAVVELIGARSKRGQSVPVTQSPHPPAPARTVGSSARAPWRS